MLSKVLSLGFKGIDGFDVEVEVDVTSGLPSFNVVGLPDANIREARDRVLSAIKNSGFDLPAKKIVVNLAPAEIKKTGTHYDLPMALAILLALNRNKISASFDIKKIYFLGELSLEGRIKPVIGILPMLISLKQKNDNSVAILPYGNEKEAVLSGVNFFKAENLKEVFLFLKGELNLKTAGLNREKLLEEKSLENILDFSDVQGQIYARRAVEIAVAGFHNILMMGPPGSGKTMIAKRIPTIMPPMSVDEILETTKIYSVCGKNNGDIILTRPFREPHHTVSDVALIGGGQNPKPGEISLAHNGVLFLDEFPEFSRTSIEALREPLENHKITVSRVRETVEYPAKFLLVASANPCPCGYLGHPVKQCICSPLQIQKYRSKISGPVLDRIDIHIEVSPVKFEEWSGKKKDSESSKQMYERISKAIEIQRKRFKGTDIKYNSMMSVKDIKKFCKIPDDVLSMLEAAMDKMGYSARSVDKIIKVSRTIADIEGSENIKKEHVIESLHYRILDKNVLGGNV